MLKALLKAMRPYQWYKNALIFIGIVFSLNLFNFSLWLSVIAAFLIFCALSGSEYIINDVIDVNKDRRHPAKSKRPIASGRLRISHAVSFALLMTGVALYGAYLINLYFFGISVLFFISTLAYSLWLKRIILVDALMISINFVIRAVAGSLAINVAISPWIILCGLLLALFLIFGKRRHEIILLGEDAKNHRGILASYNIEMLEHMTSIVAGALIISYSLYTFLAENLLMMTTIPVVIYGIFRYLLLVHSKDIGGEPEVIFKDRGMVISIIIWIILSLVILYIVPGNILERFGY
ncbi:UbiA prenyltransferase family protein [Chloroflexota bacterium]